MNLVYHRRYNAQKLMSKTLSVVIPYYNEARNLTQISREVISIYRSHLKEFDLELVFMDNHSTDGSQIVVADICAAHPEISAKIVRLSRNLVIRQMLLRASFTARVMPPSSLTQTGKTTLP